MADQLHRRARRARERRPRTRASCARAALWQRVAEARRRRRRARLADHDRRRDRVAAARRDPAAPRRALGDARGRRRHAPGSPSASATRRRPAAAAPGPGARRAARRPRVRRPSPSAPRLVLLRLRGAEAALLSAGPRSDAAASAFAAVDGELERLLRCASRRGVLPQTAFFVTATARSSRCTPPCARTCGSREAGCDHAAGALDGAGALERRLRLRLRERGAHGARRAQACSRLARRRPAPSASSAPTR